MAYTSATFYLDFENGSDAARATLTGVVFSNPGSTTVLGTYVSHGLVTGAVIDVTGCTQAYANSAWKITYVDPDTFTLDTALWASFNGADVTGNAVPRGGQSFTDAWLSITSGATAARIAPGDTIRIKKSPTPVSLAINGTWTAQPNTLPAAKNIASSTNASPIEVTSTGHGYSTGDVVYIQNHTTNLTANGVWTVTYVDANKFTLDGSVGVGIGGATGTATWVTNKVIKLASATTDIKHVDNCETAWTPSGSASLNSPYTTWYKDGDGSLVVSKTSPANTTLYAFKALAGSTDFSAYQKLSFWFAAGTAIDTTTRWSVWLCTGADGTGPVDEFRIPVTPSAGTNYPAPLNLTREGGGNCANNIQSIAIYSGSAAATSAGLYFDCFMATKTNGLSLQSLVSKNTLDQGGDEGWYPIRCISQDCKIIWLDGYPADVGATGVGARNAGGYSGSSESGIPVYRRETTKLPRVAYYLTSQTVQDSGSAGSPITFQGGWNSSPVQCDGETFIDLLDGGPTALLVSSKTYLTFDRLSIVRAGQALSLATVDQSIRFENIQTLAANTYATYISSSTGGIHFTKIHNIINGYYGINLAAGSYMCNFDEIVNILNHSRAGITVGTGTHNVFKIIKNYCGNSGMSFGSDFSCIDSNTTCSFNAGTPVTCSGSFCKFAFGTMNYNEAYAFSTTGIGNRIYSGSSTGNASGAIFVDWGQVFTRNFSPGETTKVAFGTSYTRRDQGVYFMNYNGNPASHYIVLEWGTIEYQQTVYHEPSAGAWKFSPTNAGRTLAYPLSLKLATVYCQANKEVTVKAWACRSNTGLTLMIVARQNQLLGIGSTLKSASMTAAAGTWDASQTNGEELSLTFTPTEAGVVEIEGWAYGGTTYSGYISDMEITQAD